MDAGVRVEAFEEGVGAFVPGIGVRAAEGSEEVPLAFFIPEIAGIVGVSLAIRPDMDQGPVRLAGFPVIVHEALSAGAFPAEVLRRHAGALAQGADAHVFRDGPGIVGLVGAPDGEKDGVGPIRMGLDAHIALAEAGEHIIGGRRVGALWDSRLVVEPLGVTGGEIVEQVYGRAPAVPVAVVDLVLGGVAERAREGRAVGIEAGDPVELGPGRFGVACLDVHADIAGLVYLEGADVEGPGFRHRHFPGGSVTGEGEAVGLGAGRLRGLEGQVEGPFPLRAEE